MPKRLPPPRHWAPGFPNDPLDVSQLQRKMDEQGVPSDLDAAEKLLRRLNAVQELVRGLLDHRQTITFKHLAERLGVHPDTISRFFSGHTWPDADLALLLAAELKVPLRFTVDGVAVEERAAQADRIRELNAAAILKRIREEENLRKYLAHHGFGQ